MEVNFNTTQNFKTIIHISYQESRILLAKHLYHKETYLVITFSRILINNNQSKREQNKKRTTNACMLNPGNIFFMLFTHHQSRVSIWKKNNNTINDIKKNSI